MKKLKFQIPIAIVCLVLSFAITWQIIGEQRIRAIAPPPDALQVTTELLQAMQEHNNDLTMQVEHLRIENEAFRAELLQNIDNSAVIEARIEYAETLAGMTDVEGEGLIITLSDRTVFDEFTPSGGWGLIHDEMILVLINELRTAGVEAISVNGHRILATSAIRCAGPTILINGVPEAAPFVVRAIGPARTMYNAIHMRQSAVDFIEILGASVDVRMSSNVEIGRFTGTFVPQYARPVGEAIEE